ncbi:protein FAR1-RELATED SEQUENCE 5-like [Fagus crenata]
MQQSISVNFSLISSSLHHFKFKTYFQKEKEKKIQDLYDELQHERERSATFRQQLCWILKDLEDHSQFMTLRVEDIVNSMKDIELGDL